MNTSKAHITELLMTNDKAIGRALVALNKRQTLDEQRSETTKLHNGMGFTPADARMGTSMANFFESRGYLSPKQLAYWRKPNRRNVPRIVKYAGQLLEVAREKQQVKNQPASKSQLKNVMAQNVREWERRCEEKATLAERERQQDQDAFEFKMDREMRGVN